jgi:hypothetical protein
VFFLNQVTCLVRNITGPPFPNPSDPAGSAQLSADYQALYATMAQDPVYQNLVTQGSPIVDLDLCEDIYLGPTLCQDPVYAAAGASTISNIFITTQFSNSQSLARLGVEDGFWQGTTPPYQSLSYFIPQAAFSSAFGAYLQTTLPFLALGSSSAFLPAGYLSWKLVVPKAKSYWEPLTPGSIYFQVDVVQVLPSNPRNKYAELAIADVFAVYEAAFLAVGGIPNQAFEWGFDTYPAWFFGQHNCPFIANFSLLSSTQVGLLTPVLDAAFTAGSQIRELLPADYVPFNILQLDGRSCADFDYIQCNSAECSASAVCYSAAAVFSPSFFLVLLAALLLAFTF